MYNIVHIVVTVIVSQDHKRSKQVFIYSRPIAGIRTKRKDETTYIHTYKWHVKYIIMHIVFKWHNT